MYLLVIVLIMYCFPYTEKFYLSFHPNLSFQSCVYHKQDICYLEETSQVTSNYASEKHT